MTPENKRMVLLAGYSAAGKSTLGRELRDNWGYELIEHQPLVHKIASNKGYERARHWLAEVGNNEFANESNREMVSRAKEILNEDKDKIVFDVAYGKEMLEVFQREFPNIYIIIVSIIAGEDVRVKNIQKRMNTESISEAEKELHFRDNFLHEIGLDDVLQQSNINITNKDRNISEVASELNNLIEEYLKI
jgi:dephospho-CoA kinase